MGEVGKRYTEEERAKILAQYDDLMAQPGADHATAAKLAGVAPQTMDAWLAKRKNGNGSATTGADDAKRMKTLMADNNRLRRLLIDALTGKLKIVRTDKDDGL